MVRLEKETNNPSYPRSNSRRIGKIGRKENVISRGGILRKINDMTFLEREAL